MNCFDRHLNAQLKKYADKKECDIPEGDVNYLLTLLPRWMFRYFLRVVSLVMVVVSL